MATQLTIVNNILRRLREDTVSSVNETSYSQLIAQFVNDAIDDLEDITPDWQAYIHGEEISILGDSSTRTYAVDDTNENTWLRYSFRNVEIPLAFDVTDTSNPQQLYVIPSRVNYEVFWAQDAANNPVEIPTTFTTYINTSGSFVVEILYPSTSARTWKMQLSTPQDDLLLDGTDDSTSIKLPQRPVEMRAIYYALNERGEEMGEPGGVAWQRSVNAIAAALENNKQILREWELSQFTNQETL